MPSNDSTMSVSVDPSMDHQQWSRHQQLINNQSQGAADMNLTGTQMSYSHHDASVHDSPDEQTDNQSFFQKFMGSSQAPAATGAPWMGANSDVEDDVFADDDNSPEEKTDNKSFFQQLMGNTVKDTPHSMTDLGDDSPVPDKLDSKSFLASLMGGSSSQTKADPPPATRLNNTQMFGQDETIAGMDLTTCIGGIKSTQELSSKRRPLEERIQAFSSSDMTIRFGGHNNEGGDMEMTACYGGSKQADVSMPKQSSSGRANATQIFDQSGAMEFTTCIGGITGSDRTQFTTANMSGLTFMNNKTFSNVTLDNTTKILRDLDSALGLKRKSDIPTEELQDTRTEKLRRGSEEPYESTRVFSGSFVPGKLSMRDSHQAAPVLSPIKKEAGDVDQGVCGEETAAIELTSCIKAREFNNVQQSSVPTAMESTRIFQGDDTVGMEFTNCVGSELLQRHNSEPKPADSKGDRTKMFSANDSGDMEMTECHSVVVTANTSLSSNKSRQAVGALAELERTKVFKPDETCGMEFTTCVDNLIVQNSANKEAANSTSTDNVIQQSQLPHDIDKTKVFQPDDTCGMEFTTCVGDVIVNSQSSRNESRKQDVKSHSEPTMNSTKIHQPNETCGMEFTTCLGSMIEAKNNASTTVQFKGKGNCTRLFDTEDTAKMEMTACVGQIAASQNSKGKQNVNRTRVFSEEMEMTECIESYVPSGQQQQVNVSLNSSKRVPFGEVTKVFSDNTAKMEMTECIGGVVANASQTSLPREKSSTASFSHTTQEKRTRVFTDDVGGMEMTECIGGVLANTSEVTALPKGKSPAASFSHPGQEERTRVFTDDVGGMEMTECIGGVLANTSQVTTLPKGKSLAASFSHPGQEERTRVFTDDVGGMEMTECIGGVLANTSQVTTLPKGKSLAASFSHPGQEERTRVFTDDVGGMEMTECIGGVLANTSQVTTLPKGKSPAASFSHPRQDEQTRVFSDDVGGMEMTECIGGVQANVTGASTLQKEKSPSAPVNQHNQEERTRVFSADVGGMKMTECIGGVLVNATQASTNQKEKSPSVPVNQHSQEERTKVFSADVGGMEMTECIGGLIPASNLHNTSSKQEMSPKDHTKVFMSEHTAKMDMTECVGGLFPDFTHKITEHSNQNESVVAHSRLHSETENTTKMNMTESDGGVFPSFASTSKTNSSMSRLKQLQADFEHTKVFSDNNGKMEMTECVSSAFPTFAHNISSNKAPVVSDKTECTQVFSEDTGRMEMTECVSTVFPSFASNVGLASAKKENRSSGKNVLDQTKIFSEDTCRMEMTECVGGVFPSFAPKLNASVADDKESEHPVGLSHSRLATSKNLSIIAEGKSIRENSSTVGKADIVTDHTQVFSGNDGGMEMTECISIADVVRDETTRNIRGDVTKIFSEHTAKMEMTECIGGSVFVRPSESGNVSEKPVMQEELQGEHTRVFSENTTRMDMTECVSGVISTDTDTRKEKVSTASACEMGEDVESKTRVESGDVTKVFSEHTAKMEMTECIGSVLTSSGASENVNRSRLGDGLGHGEHTKVFSENTAKMDMTECIGGMLPTTVDEKEESSTKNAAVNMASDQPKEEASGIADEEKRRSDTFTLDKSKMETSVENVGNETKRSSDTFTITKTSLASPQSDHHGEEEEKAKDEELRRSDTFTIDKSSLGKESSQDTKSEKAQEKSDLDGTKAGDGERLSSVESYTGEEIMEEETLVMDVTEELEDYSALLKKGFKGEI